jgi:endoglucanase
MGYDLALGLSFLFYEANRSGDLDEANNRIPWRGDSGLNDGRDGIYFGDANLANLQAGLSLDLTGGYHDAGDHVKFGLPLASTLSTLAWGGISFADGYQATDQMDALLETVRWGTDYLLKAQGRDATGATTYFIAQVGDGDADHALWSAPEDQTIQRPAMAVTPEKPGSDVAAASAAALASASILFRLSGEQSYADTLLDASVSLYEFADCYRGKYSDSIGAVQSFYNSWSGYHDELAYGAAWLARAVEADGGEGNNYRATALDLYQNEIVGLNNGWTHNWDDASYATAVLLAQDAGDAEILADVRLWLDSWVEGTNGVQITDGGLRHISTWGSLRYAANTAMMAGEVADELIDPDGRYSQLASETIDYILGSNPRQSSYVVGFGNNFPQQPHHRAASGVGWDEFNSDQPNAHVLAGALVGGPSAADDFAYSDSRLDYISNEVAIDYNAGLTGALAFLSQL